MKKVPSLPGSHAQYLRGAIQVQYKTFWPLRLRFPSLAIRFPQHSLSSLSEEKELCKQSPSRQRSSPQYLRLQHLPAGSCKACMRPGMRIFLEKGYKCKWKSIWPLEGPPDQLSLPIPGAGIPSSFLPPAQACLQEVTSSPCFSVAVPGMWCKPSRLSKDLDLFSLRVARMSILGHWKPPTSYLQDSWFCKVCHIALSRAAYSSSPYNMGCF